MILATEHIDFISWKKVAIPFFVFELILLLLIYLDPLFATLFVLGLSGIVFFYVAFLNGPLVWILLMIFSSGLDAWGKIGGGVTLFHLAWFLSIVTSVFYILKNPNFKLKFDTPITKIGFTFLFYATFSLIYSPNYVDGLRLLGTTFALFFSFFVFVNFLKTKFQFKLVVFTLAIINVFLSLLTFYQLLFQNDKYFGTSTVATSSGEKVWRATGTFEDPNVTATFLMVSIILSISVVLFSKEKVLSKLFLIGSVLISFVGIVATFSRSGWLAVAIGIFTLFFFLKNKKSIFYAITAVAIVVGTFIIVTPYGEFLIDRVFSTFDLMKDPSIRARIFMGVSSLWMFFDNIIFGVGFRGYPALYDFYVHPDTPQILLYVKESHTLWTTVLAELGVIGFVLVFIWFKRIYIDGLEIAKSITDPFMRSLSIGVFAVFIAFNVDFLFYGFLFPHFNLFWLVLGIMYALYLNKEKYI